MTRPYELDVAELEQRLDEMVDSVFADIQSSFLVLPRGPAFVPYPRFEGAYQALRRATGGFRTVTEETVWMALREDALAMVVLRAILGFSPPEWADVASSERGVKVPQGAARSLDREVREDSAVLRADRLARRRVTRERCEALVAVAVQLIREGAPEHAEDSIHRLAKADTQHGSESLRHVSQEHVPYAVLLYERYLGRPFASHRDAVSELVGDVMEDAIEQRLRGADIAFRRTGRAERVPGFDQAPDFFVPDEFNPQIIIEAKITQDDGTARDKVARLLRLAAMRDDALRSGRRGYQLVACVDGRGFGVRRQDMIDLLRATEGKVFTLATLRSLVPATALAEHRAVAE